MTDQVDLQPEGAVDQNQAADAPQFAVQKIYTKDMSFEAPNTPEVFSLDVNPNIKMEMNSKSRRVADNNFEVVLSITVTALIEEEKTAFLAEVQQAGVFFVSNLNDQQTHHALGAMAPEILFPYAREAIANEISRGGFAPIHLAPVNFQALYQAQLAKAMEAAKAEAGEQAEAPAAE